MSSAENPTEYWEQRTAVAQTAMDYSRRQIARYWIGNLVARGFEQLALPIEAAMEEEGIPED